MSFIGSSFQCLSTLSTEVLPDDAILDVPSLVTPLLLKKGTRSQPREKASTSGKTAPNLSPADAEGILKDKLQGHNQATIVIDISDDPDETIPKTNPETAPAVAINNPITNSSERNIAKNNRQSINNYVHKATVASMIHTRTSSDIQMTYLEDYYKSSVGQMLVGIGLSRVREFNLECDEKKLALKIKRSYEDDLGLIERLKATRDQLSQARISNKAYTSNEAIHKCPRCPFKSEFSIVMGAHMEVPHKNKRDHLCNWCSYKSKDSNLLVYHNLVEHKKRCRIEKEPSLHNCRFCQFESKTRRKWTTHVTRCIQFFPHQTFMGPQDFGQHDFPAITSKPISREDIRSYEQALKTIRLAAYNPHQLRVSTGSQQQDTSKLPLLVVSRPNRSTLPGNYVFGDTVDSSNNSSSILLGRNSIGSSLALLASPQSRDKNSFPSANNSAQILHLISSQGSEVDRNKSGVMHQHPKQIQSCFMNGKSVIRTAADIIMPPCNPSNQNNNLQLADSAEIEMDSNRQSHINYASGSSPASKGCTFVICEICDSYIKDLGQLKLHMAALHKVRIHSRTLESRPPLNCQKCQWRFFTDQGLERHLLGAHALVTSNMQELVDNGTDGGRCSICGRAFANKLVAHMKEVHKANLKPAHLSYKCTVCSATFNLYRLFENHVYSVHGESVRRGSGN